MRVEPSNLLPLQAAARRIGVKKASLKSAAESGDLPSVRVGGDLLFDVVAIQAILSSRADSRSKPRKRPSADTGNDRRRPDPRSIEKVQTALLAASSVAATAGGTTNA